MSGSPTTIPSIGGEGFAARIADLFPRGWASDDAKQVGNVYALLLSIGNELAVTQAEVQYALAAQRIQTETFPELDFASIDFLGSLLPRPAGASDLVFGQEIIAALFQAAATRTALQNALIKLTGYVPRMMEPWAPADTGAWRSISYWNVDTVSNPARWGNGGLRYQGFIETAPPSIAAIGNNNPILAWRDSAYWNVPGYFFGIIQPTNQDSVNALLSRLHAYGTIVWVKLVSSGSLGVSTAPSAVTNLTASAGGTNSILLSWGVPVTGTPPYTFTALYRQTGTVSFVTGPTVSGDSATVANLSPGVSYDFAVQVRNIAGTATSGTATEITNLVPPAPAQSLTATQVQATAVTLLWSAPTSGTPPFTYTVNYRITGTTIWQTMGVGAGATGVTIINLVPSTEYDFEVVTSNVGTVGTTT